MNILNTVKLRDIPINIGVSVLVIGSEGVGGDKLKSCAKNEVLKRE